MRILGRHTAHAGHRRRGRSHAWRRAATCAVAVVVGGAGVLAVSPPPVGAAVGDVARPTFSIAHGFKTAPFQLALASATPGASIRYTLNGATPTPTSGTLYTGPFTISTTTAVRAVAYTSSTSFSYVEASTYLFTAAIRNQPNSHAGYPSTFAATDADGPYPADYEMDPEVVNHPSYTGQIDNALTQIPSVSITTDIANLFDPATGIYYNSNEKGSAWERPINIEYIDPSGGAGFSANGGLRIHGQASRRPHRTPKHTFRVYFKSSYGTPKLDFKLFDGNGEVFDPVGSFDRLVLRNGGNRSWPYWDRDQRRETDYVNDQWARQAHLEMGRLSPHGTATHLYINGIYWGLYQTAERIDEKFYAAYLPGGETNFDVIAADEDLGDIPVAAAGTIDAYNELLNLVGGTSPISDAQLQTIATKLDLADLADYILLTHYIGKTDWPNHNYDIYRMRSGSDTRFKFSMWDADSGLNKVNENVTTGDYEDTPQHIFLRLTTNAEFRQILADRVELHTGAGGALSPQRCAERYSALTAAIDSAIIAESARWGDYSRDVYQWANADPPKSGPAYLYTKDLPNSFTDPGGIVDDSVQKTWAQVRSEKLATYCPGRAAQFKSQYRTNGWFSDTLQRPAFSTPGGAVPTGFNLAITNPNGTTGDIVYTVDGSDPRVFGGATAPSAIVAGDSVNVAIADVVTVKARIRNGTTWSNLTEYTFYPPQPGLAAVEISEIHYSPTAVAPDNPDDYEFIEVHNRGASAVRLDNASFTRGVSFRFAANATIGANQRLVLAADPAKFQERYGFAPAGDYRGNLSNQGEAVELKTATGTLIDAVTYSTSSPWPAGAAGTGPSLTLNAPGLDNSQGSNWSAAAATPGSGPSGGGNVSPVVSLTAPAGAVSVPVGSAVALAASASDADGSVASVVFRANGVAIAGCSDSSAPFGCSFTPSAAGSYVITALATDNLGATSVSSSVTVTATAAGNVSPVVSLTAPAGAVSVPVGSAVALAASASDADGSVASVVFRANGVAIAGCSDSSAPFGCSFTPSAAGSYVITALATDNLGATSVSSSVTVTATSGGGGTGAFLESGGAVAMEAENFATSAPAGGKSWVPGSSPAGAVGQSVTALANTGTSISSNITTTSPRTDYPVQFSTPGTYSIWARAFGPTGSDDSVYVGVDGVPGASSSVSGAAWIWKKVGTVNVTAAGTKVVSLWMREDGTSVDRFVVSLGTAAPSGTGPAESPRAGGGNVSPVVSLTAPAGAVSVPVGSAVALAASASDADGSVASVVFRANGVAIAGCSDSSAPFGCSFTPSAAGSYVITALATDNLGATSVSVSSSVTVTATAAGNVSPVVSLTAPAGAVSVPVGSAVALAASASDADGSVASVVFRANGVAIAGCSDSSAPFGCSFTPSAAGSYVITALATDNLGATSVSSSVTVTATSGGGGTGPYIETGGLVVMEAEAGTVTARGGSSWTATTTPAGAVGQAMVAGPNSGKSITTNITTTSPDISLPVSVSTAGTYTVWVRAFGATGSDDSLHCAVDGAVIGSPAVSGATWIWKKVTTTSLAAGVRSFQIFMREDGTVVDRVLLTTNSSFVPTGDGPAASARS